MSGTLTTLKWFSCFGDQTRGTVNLAGPLPLGLNLVPGQSSQLDHMR